MRDINKQIIRNNKTKKQTKTVDKENKITKKAPEEK
jgi:hypothetical protein